MPQRFPLLAILLFGGITPLYSTTTDHSTTNLDSESAHDASTAQAQILHILQEQKACLQTIQSSKDAEEARLRYLILTAQLAQTHKLADDEELLRYLNRHPQEKQNIIEALQALAMEIARLKKANFYGNTMLGTVLIPPLPKSTTPKGTP